MARRKAENQIKEPSMVVRPVSKLGGLDYIHVALAALVVILIALLLVVSYGKPTTTTNHTVNTTNVTGVKALHNSTQVKMIMERFLASYQNINSSFSLLPFSSNVSAINVSFVPSLREWYSTVPVRWPGTNQTFTLSAIVNDLNGSVVLSQVQISRPAALSSNYVVAQGVVKVSGAYACGTNQTSLYWFIDPYTPGSLQSLSNMTALRSKYGGELNATVKILFSQYSERIADAYGLNNSEALGEYLFCASTQDNFSGFVNNVEVQSANGYVSRSALSQLANVSKLNTSALNTCLSTSLQKINYQALLAQHYNITSSPLTLTDCQYLAIPQTTNNALCYDNNRFC